MVGRALRGGAVAVRLLSEVVCGIREQRGDAVAAATDWVRAFNALFGLLDQAEAPTYYSGGRFISKVREIDPYFPDYGQFIEERKRTNKSTTRRNYYYDILRDFDEDRRLRILHRILDDLESHDPMRVQDIRAMLGGIVPGPTAEISVGTWNAHRLARTLDNIDDSITSQKYDRAVTLSYSCLEGYYKAFVRKKVPTAIALREIIDLSKEIKKFISVQYPAYPGELLNMIGHVSHAVDRARNQMSESHFDGEAARWLAVYVRDLVNTQIRLLEHFYGDDAA